ncbi:MAG: 3-phosphoglycerate dehydrogenase [Bacteroidetes bacterium]|nr:3-phosphoglycerate dehydrogenase [Bacteroidota bacterium]MBU1579314.1 3-phosphoglycerate dehydrogenase [Bacteroidota bacterium]MBU2465177.1 3-phosphoglycerate dehydrogenase [Bacteroidota bacterium]MBU2556818.1 3-phosphoglycerate dehydrogenase [Bacteroidota bacterium]
MTKVLIATEKPFAKVAAEQIKGIITSAGYSCVFLEKYTDHQDFVQAAKDADAIIIRSDKANQAVIENAEKLKIIVRAGAGYDNVDLQAATAKGVVVMNTPGQNSNAVAELALGMMVYQARNHFNGSSGTELKEKTLGIHAYGNVGKNVARIAKGFGMKVIAFDPFVADADIKKDGVEVVKTVEELYSQSNYVSLHIPANEKTKNSINYELLSKMPANAMLVNTARKEVIDEAGLKQLLSERSDFRYVSDIAPSNTGELEAFSSQLFFTPKKMGAQTSEANINAGIAAAEQIIGFIEKGDITFKVN